MSNLTDKIKAIGEPGASEGALRNARKRLEELHSVGNALVESSAQSPRKCRSEYIGWT